MALAPGSQVAASTGKVFFTGTHRVRHPAHTWSIIAPILARFGITRIANVTGLDVLGIPVAMAIRPLAKTLSVSQGKGFSYELARVSAAMEAIEFWHVENVQPDVAYRSTPGDELTLPYQVASLVDPAGLVNDGTPLDWIPAVGLLTGSPTVVPLSLVAYAHKSAASWVPTGLTWSTNGLASGNSWHEASLHGLYEVLERDAVGAVRPGDSGLGLDPLTVEDASCAELIDRIRSSGATLEIYRLPSRFDIVCFGARVWSADFPVVCLGWGAHCEPEIALSRAVTEAAQSRLTTITGSRDDLPSIYDHVRHSVARAPERSTAPSAWREVASGSTPTFTDVADELRWVGSAVARVTGCEPLLVDLSTDDEFSVVKVIVPGAEFDVDRVHPRY